MVEQERKKISVERVENTGWDERILVFRCAPIVDAFAVVTDRYVVVVDTLINPQTASTMMAHLGSFLEDARQLLVVNTHADWDHTWGNQIFVEPQALNPAPIIAQRKVIKAFESPSAPEHLQKMRSQNPGVFDGVRLTPPNLFFDDKLLINGGDLTLELFATPGHTEDHCSVYIPEIRTLLVGDAAESPYPSARETRFFPQLRRTLEALAEREPAIALYCHAPGVTTAEVIHDNIAYFEALERCCREAIKRGDLPESLSEEADLITLTNCDFEDAIPPRRNPPELNDYYRIAGHQEQIWMTLEMLQNR